MDVDFTGELLACVSFKGLHLLLHPPKLCPRVFSMSQIRGIITLIHLLRLEGIFVAVVLVDFEEPFLFMQLSLHLQVA